MDENYNTFLRQQAVSYHEFFANHLREVTACLFIIMKIFHVNCENYEVA